MISMTTYWQQFKECVDTLPEATEGTEYLRQMNTARSLINVGLTIEKLGITEIKQVANKLQDLAKLYNNLVTFKAPGKEYKFNLPKITDTNSLIFAINYYQHLANYEQVNYQGSIGFLFKGLVASSINEKKVPTHNQAKAMLAEIRQYCASQNMEINEAVLRKESAETAQVYTTRILNMVNQAQEKKEDSNKPKAELSELEKLQQNLDEIRKKKTQLKNKIDNFTKKHNEYNQAQQKHLEFSNEWKNTWFITQVFYQFMSWFFEVSILKNIKDSAEQLAQAEFDLNEQLPENQTAESYSGDLILQVRKLNNDFGRTEDKITQYNELQRIKERKAAREAKAKAIEVQKINASMELKKEIEPSHLDFLYSFFRENKQLVQATAVAAVAIVVQNLAYG